MLKGNYPVDKFVIKFKNKIHLEKDERYEDIETIVSFNKAEFHKFFACDKDNKRLKVKNADGEMVEKFQPIKATYPFRSYEVLQNPYHLEAKKKETAKK